MKAVLSFTALEALLLVATIVVANRIAGGLVAFQLALNFFYLPAAIITWPVTRALVPRLAAFHQTKRLGAFRKEYSEAIGLVSFASIPIAVAYAVSASVIAEIIASAASTGPTRETTWLSAPRAEPRRHHACLVHDRELHALRGAERYDASQEVLRAVTTLL
jgi:putative peptidoglycan lipid II flippase